ncbi:MAG: NADH-quinone oxidoreductase subunit L [Actinomycetota bacterium]
MSFLAEAGEHASETVHEAAAVVPGLIRYTWIIPVLLLLSAAATLFLGKRVPGKGALLGIGALVLAFGLSLGVLWHFVQGGETYTSAVPWFSIGSLDVGLGQYVDGLTAIMLVVVTSISLCVHVYSLGYMHGDTRFTWFYVVLSLFTAAMLNVVIADNLIQLLVGWEVMGVCSYLLIGHWYEEKKNSNAAIKAFITTRIGDIPFMFGVFILIGLTGFTTANIAEIGHVIAGENGETVSRLAVSMAAILLFGGTIGKSAQFPLNTWLPDAMAGPTPVSALIHAATMVAAGVYLVGRLFEVFLHAEQWVLTTVSVVAAITMLGAAFLAVVQDDIKRVLAYSTVSQLAFMVAGLSMGEAGYTAGFFHLFTHAFFKGLLFLAAGAVIHGVHSNNMSEMGGLWKKMPITFWTFLIGALALAGFPGLAGFWSKDELLVVANHEGSWLFYALLGTAVLTAFYMTRCVLMTFFGTYRGHAHPHESPPSMTGPLIALAAASIFVGWIGSPVFQGLFGQWVFFEEIEEAKLIPWIALLSTAAAFIGIGVGYALYRRWQERDPTRALGRVYTVLERKYYQDELYDWAFVRPVRDKLSVFANWTNQHILDGIVNAMPMMARGLGVVTYWFDQKVIDGVVDGAAETVAEAGGILKYLQSGRVQRYAALLILGLALLTIIIITIQP